MYLCRYCLLFLTEFHGSDPAVCGPQWTPETYRSSTELLEREDVSEVRWMKFRSVFNYFKNVNVCTPGMPPCLGNDIFEGVFSYDRAVYHKYFINTNKLFTYIILNRPIKQFKQKGTGASSKPCEVCPKTLKLSGQAVQNGNFLRFLPLVIGEKVQNPQDNV